MKLLSEDKLPLLNFLSNLAIVFLLIISIGYILIVKEYEEFYNKSKRIEREYTARYEQRLKTEVERVIDYIDYYKSQTESRLKQEIRHRVYQAIDVAKYIHNKYRNIESEAKIKQRIKDALYPLRWRKGYSYLWIFDTNGTAVLFPINPKIENHYIFDYKDAHGKPVLKEAYDLAMRHNEGYITKIYVRAQNGHESEQIAFVKLFKPYGWIVGTGETIDDIEKDIKYDILQRVAQMRFDKEGYFGIIDTQGTILAHPFIPLGTNLHQTTNPYYKKLGKKLIEVGKRGGFLLYDFRKLSSPAIAKKITYAKAIPDWGWIVFAGIYLDQLQETIAKKKAELEQELNHKVQLLLLIFSSFTFLALLLSLFFSQRLKKIFDEYKEKIECRTKILEKLNKKLQEKERQALAASDAKTLFISNISHDIRTPLNAILGYAQILAKDESLDTIQKEKVQKILTHGSYLLDLLDDVIEVSKIDAGKMELNEESFDLKKFLENIEELYQDKAKAKGLAWRVIGKPAKETFVVGDKKKLFRVLVNLIGNAFKYTDYGQVELIVKPKDHNGYTFIVSDTGIGIEPKEQESIFQTFTQAAAGQMRGGKGLGLSIASRYVQLMGGKLLVESFPKKGSKFYFTIPLRPALTAYEEHTEQKVSNKETSKPNPQKFTLTKKQQEELLNLAKLGNISKLKENVQSLNPLPLRNVLKEFLHAFDLEGFIQYVENIPIKN